jgi:hypothetical protein
MVANKSMDFSVCVFCGSPEEIERDHVPPKCLFPAPAPNNLITVPSCRKCNQSFSKDEEYFRVIVSQIAEAQSHPATRKLLNEKILKSMTRRPKLATKIMSSVVPVHIYDGEKFMGTGAGFDLENQSFDRVMIKIVKGLLYHEKGIRVSEAFVVKWNVIHERIKIAARLHKALENSPVHALGDNVFEYQGYVLKGSAASFWLMRFYLGPTFYAAIFDRSKLEAQNR